MGNTVGVVVVAFIAGIFLILMILVSAASLWVAWDTRKKGIALLEHLKEAEKSRVSDLEEMKKILETGRGVFQGVKTSLQAVIDAQSTEIRQTLKLFEDGFKASMKNLNGKALLEASKVSVDAVKRLNDVAHALHQVLLATEESRATPREWMDPARADEQAPEGESRIGKSIYAVDTVDEDETAAAFRRVTGNLF